MTMTTRSVVQMPRTTFSMNIDGYFVEIIVKKNELSLHFRGRMIISPFDFVYLCGARVCCCVLLSIVSVYHLCYCNWFPLV